MLVEDKIAVVTRASRGLGQAFTMGLAGEGAKVVVNGGVADDVQKVVAGIKERGGTAVGCTETVATMAGGKKLFSVLSITSAGWISW